MSKYISIRDDLYGILDDMRTEKENGKKTSFSDAVQELLDTNKLLKKENQELLDTNRLIKEENQKKTMAIEKYKVLELHNMKDVNNIG